MKSVYAYNRRTGQQHRRGGGPPVGGGFRDYRSSYPSVGVHEDSMKNGDTDEQLTEWSNDDESKHLEPMKQVDQVSEGDEALPMDTAPPTIAGPVEEVTQSIPPAAVGVAQPLPSSEETLSVPTSSASNLRISIPLSHVAVTTRPTVTTHPATPTEHSDFNYDDYLDQLNDEEEDVPGGAEGSKVKPSTDNRNIPSTLPDKFWIDTAPTGDSNPVKLASFAGNQQSQATSKDPLEEDFPSITGDKVVSRSDELVNSSLRALVNQDSIDDTIASEEGKVSTAVHKFCFHPILIFHNCMYVCVTLKKLTVPSLL